MLEPNRDIVSLYYGVVFNQILSMENNVSRNCHYHLQNIAHIPKKYSCAIIHVKCQKCQNSRLIRKSEDVRKLGIYT